MQHDRYDEQEAQQDMGRQWALAHLQETMGASRLPLALAVITQLEHATQRSAFEKIHRQLFGKHEAFKAFVLESALGKNRLALFLLSETPFIRRQTRSLLEMLGEDDPAATASRILLAMQQDCGLGCSLELEPVPLHSKPSRCLCTRSSRLAFLKALVQLHLGLPALYLEILLEAKQQTNAR